MSHYVVIWLETNALSIVEFDGPKCKIEYDQKISVFASNKLTFENRASVLRTLYHVVCKCKRPRVILIDIDSPLLVEWNIHQKISMMFVVLILMI